MSFKLLKNYIQNKMKMSHIYQPVMIKSLINNNGRNNSKNIAKEITLTEFIEQYNKYYDYVSLASLWYSVNDDITYDEAIKYVGGTDPD